MDIGQKSLKRPCRYLLCVFRLRWCVETKIMCGERGRVRVLDAINGKSVCLFPCSVSQWRFVIFLFPLSLLCILFVHIWAPYQHTNMIYCIFLAFLCFFCISCSYSRQRLFRLSNFIENPVRISMRCVPWSVSMIFSFSQHSHSFFLNLVTQNFLAKNQHFTNRFLVNIYKLFSIYFSSLEIFLTKGKH